MGTFGGKQPGAGRPPGSLNKATIEKNKVEAALHQRVLDRVDEIIDHQLQLSRGHSYLFKITEVRDKKGKPELVTDPEEIANYLAGQEKCEGYKAPAGNIYYYITTDKPEKRAIDSMLDRVFGKATQKTDITSGGEKITPILGGLSEKPKEEEDDGSSVGQGESA